MSTVKATNFSHPSAANPAIVLDAAGGATVAGMGLVLVSPTSIANSGGSASASGGQVSFTGVSSVSLNGVFTSVYQNYKMILNFEPSTGVNMQMRLRASGTDNSASSYQTNATYVTNSSWNAWRYANATLFTFAGSDNGYISVATMDIYNPQLSTATPITFNHFGAASQLNVVGGGSHLVASSFDGFSLIASSGAVTGTVRVYGYKNS